MCVLSVRSGLCHSEFARVDSYAYGHILEILDIFLYPWARSHHNQSGSQIHRLVQVMPQSKFTLFPPGTHRGPAPKAKIFSLTLFISGFSPSLC